MTFTTNCPSCGETLDVDDDYRGWTVRCPSCRHEFVAETDEPPRPRRRSRSGYGGRRSRYDEPDVEAARTKVSAPATFLEVVGWGSVALCVLIGLILILAGMEAQGRPQRQRQPGNNDDPVFFFVMATCLGGFGIPYSIIMAIGARKMRNLSSRGWAMTAAVLGVAAIVIFGLFGVFHIAAGVWALVALSDPNVTRSFGYRHRRYERDDEYDEYDDY
jgi:hypothetical protein